MASVVKSGPVANLTTHLKCTMIYWKEWRTSLQIKLEDIHRKAQCMLQLPNVAERCRLDKVHCIVNHNTDNSHESDGKMPSSIGP